MNATLTIRDLDDGFRLYTVDCRHGRTEALALRADWAVGDAQMAAAAVAKHHAEEHCPCTEQLRAQYPPELIPATIVALRI